MHRLAACFALGLVVACSSAPDGGGLTRSHDETAPPSGFSSSTTKSGAAPTGCSETSPECAGSATGAGDDNGNTAGSPGDGGTGTGTGTGTSTGGKTDSTNAQCKAGMACKPGSIRYCDEPAAEWTKSTCDATGNWGPCVAVEAPVGPGCDKNSYAPEKCCPGLKLCCQDNPSGPFVDFGSGGCAAIACP